MSDLCHDAGQTRAPAVGSVYRAVRSVRLVRAWVEGSDENSRQRYVGHSGPGNRGGGVGLMRGFERRNLASQSLDMTPIAQRTGVEARERTGESVT